MNNNIYKFYNCNPHSTLTQDCAIRALTAFTGKDYWDILDDLISIYKKNGYHIIDPVCFMLYLDSLRIYKQTLIKFPQIIQLKTFCEDIQNGVFDKKLNHTLVLLQNSHLTYVQNGIIQDIWDCSKLNISAYWIKKD